MTETCVDGPEPDATGADELREASSASSSKTTSGVGGRESWNGSRFRCCLSASCRNCVRLVASTPMPPVCTGGALAALEHPSALRGSSCKGAVVDKEWIRLAVESALSGA